MTALLRSLTLPYLRQNALRVLLTLFGVVIGVQGMVAVGALNASILASFASSVEAIAGTASLQIAGPETGIPEELATEAAQVPGVESATAMIQGTFQTLEDPPHTIMVYGVDLLEAVGKRSPQFPREHVHIEDELRFLNALDSIALGTPLIERLGLSVGSSLRLATPEGVRTFTVRGTLDPVGPAKLYAGSVALLDLPTAQNFLLAPGLVQTVYVTAQAGESVDAVAERLRVAIGDRARVERTEVKGQQVDAMLGSLRVALALASLVTMIVAFFIIYQAMAVSVDQRRREIAIARALGFTRRSIAGVFLIEALLMGMAGAAGGIVGGYWLARLSLQTAVAGITDMYVRVNADTVVLPLLPVASAAGFGILTCVLAGLAPAIRAARQHPAEILRSTAGIREESPSAAVAFFGLATIAIATIVLAIDLRLETSAAKTAWILLGHGMLLMGMALVAPVLVAGFARVIALVSRAARFEVAVASEFFSRRPRRLGATASAIMVGFALVVVLGAVVHSITGTISGWLGQMFASQLVVITSPGLTSGAFDMALIRKLSTLPGIRSVERYRRTLTVIDGRPTVLMAFDNQGRPDGIPLNLVSSAPNPFVRSGQGEIIFVSESFAFRHGSRIGDRVTLDTAVGERTFEIGAIVRDYSLDLGTVFVDIDHYQRLWRDRRLSYANLWTEPSADLVALRRAVQVAVGLDPRVSVVTNREFRMDIETRVHNLLRVLGSLQIFACVIAVLGVVTFLLAALLDRRREISLLRSCGLTRTQIISATVIEAGFVGLTGAVLGLAVGFISSYFMVTHSIRVDMGWTLEFGFPIALALSTLVTITCAAAVAGYVPARHITRGSVLAGLQAE